MDKNPGLVRRLINGFNRFTAVYQPTWRTLFLSLLVILFFGLSAINLLFLAAMLLISAGTIAMLWFDYKQAPLSADFQLQRQHPQRFSLGQIQPVEIIVENRSRHAYDIELWDMLPATFTFIKRGSSRRPHWQARLKANGIVKFPYQVRPTRRGDRLFGHITLRWTSQRGLFMKQVVYHLPTVLKVYPNLIQIRQYEQLVRRGRQIQIGLRQAQQFGSGSEFEQLRDYVPDDDYRRISWKATARQGKPITMDFSPERSQNIILMVDASRQMQTRPLGLAQTTRLDLVINAVLLFSYVALKRGDRVGLLVFAGAIHHYVPPRAGSTQLTVLLEGLYNLEPQAADPNFALALQYLQSQRQRRSLIVLLTDPTHEEAIDTLVPHLGAFYPHHLPLCVTLSDPNVLAAAQRSPYSMSAIQERAMAEEILDDRQVWRHLLERRGVMTMDIPAYHLTAALLNKYLEIKGQTRI